MNHVCHRFLLLPNLRHAFPRCLFVVQTRFYHTCYFQRAYSSSGDDGYAEGYLHLADHKLTDYHRHLPIQIGGRMVGTKLTWRLFWTWIVSVLRLGVDFDDILATSKRDYGNKMHVVSKMISKNYKSSKFEKGCVFSLPCMYSMFHPHQGLGLRL